MSVDRGELFAALRKAIQTNDKELFRSVGEALDDFLFECDGEKDVDQFLALIELPEFPQFRLASDLISSLRYTYLDLGEMMNPEQMARFFDDLIAIFPKMGDSASIIDVAELIGTMYKDHRSFNAIKRMRTQYDNSALLEYVPIALKKFIQSTDHPGFRDEALACLQELSAHRNVNVRYSANWMLNIIRRSTRKKRMTRKNNRRADK